jgi:hypothetical protein
MILNNPVTISEQSGPYGDKLNQNFLRSEYYTGTGSTVILPVVLGRFGGTNSINFGARASTYCRYSLNRRTVISGISIAYTATTATTKTLTSITESSGTATATSTAHGFSAGDRVSIIGATPSIYNGTKVILTVPTADTFTFSVTAGTGSASGSISARQFLGAAIYSADPLTLLPRTKLADVASIPSTSNVVTNLDSNLTLNAGMYWVALCASKFTNNETLVTLVTADENSSGYVNTLLFGIRTSDMSQYRGGVGLRSYDNGNNPYTSNGNSGMPAEITGVGSVNLIPGGLTIESNASAGGTLASKIPMVGLVVA